MVAVGGDGAMYDIGFQNLSRLMASGKPIKVLVVDTQVYSNTGGQACTSGFVGQISDMAQYGKVQKGKQEARKEIGLIGMAHRTTYVMQGTIANASHMIEGFIRGLKARRPALFNLYSSCQPEHGIGDDMSAHQARLAVESRAYPVFRYDPAAGKTPAECFDLEGNPALDQDWPTYKLKYRSGNRDKEMELPLTFADFAITEARFRKHYRIAPPDTWNENMVPLVDFLDLDAADREGKFPYIWSVDRKQQLSRLLVDSTIVESCEDRRDFWTMLRALAGVGKPEITREEIEADVRRDLAGRIGAALVDLASGGGGAGALAAAVSRGAPRQRRWRQRCRRRGGRSGRKLPGALARHRAVHRLRRVHADQSEDLRLQRRQEGVTSRTRRAAPTRIWSRRRRSARRGSSTPACRRTAPRRTSRNGSRAARSTTRTGSGA